MLFTKSSENSKILPKIYYCATVPRIKGCQLEAVGARGCGGIKMLFVLLTININNLYKTFHNVSPGCKSIGIVFKASLEPKLELPIKPS